MLSTQNPSTPTPNTQTQLDLVDLQNLLMIVDLASQRGAFKGPELSQVGTVFDKVAKFLQSVAPQTQGTDQTANAPVADPVMPSSNPGFFSTQGNN